MLASPTPANKNNDQVTALTAISVATQEIAASLDLDQTLRLVMDKAAETLPMDAGALFRFVPESSSFSVAASHNLARDLADKLAFELREGVPGWVFDNKKQLLIPDATVDKRVHTMMVRDGVLSVLSLPLLARERVVGVLNLYSRSRKNAFGEESIFLARVFANQAAIAIENARLVGRLRRSAEELETRVDQRTAELRASQAQAVRSEKLAAVGRLAGSIAHEVNNPLQAVTLHLELLGNDPLPDKSRKRLSVVAKEVRRISGLINQLLDFQRPSKGERKNHDVEDLLDEVLALSRKQLEDHKIQVTVVSSQQLPLVNADGGQLKQVFLNLILNAADAMPIGGDLQIRAHMNGSSLDVKFTDTGAGMSPDVLAHLFEPFFSTKDRGTGLGLAISHEIVKQHGGTLEVESSTGAGTTFTVRLPPVEAGL